MGMFNSAGHAAQGALSWLLFPATEFLLAQRSTHLALGARAASLLVVVYPLYNVVKRLKLHGNYFALCSFFNNGLEWAMGFFLGLSLGTLFTEVEAFDLGVLRAKTADLGDIAWEQAWDALEGTRSVAGLLLLLVTARSAFQ